MANLPDSDRGVEMLTNANREEIGQSFNYHNPDAYTLLESVGMLEAIVSFIMSAQQVAYDEGVKDGEV